MKISGQVLLPCRAVGPSWDLIGPSATVADPIGLRVSIRERDLHSRFPSSRRSGWGCNCRHHRKGHTSNEACHPQLCSTHRIRQCFHDAKLKLCPESGHKPADFLPPCCAGVVPNVMVLCPFFRGKTVSFKKVFACPPLVHNFSRVQ